MNCEKIKTLKTFLDKTTPEGKSERIPLTIEPESSHHNPRSLGKITLSISFTKEHFLPGTILVVMSDAFDGENKQLSAATFELKLLNLKTNVQDIGCKIHPKEGVSLTTKFKITCTGYLLQSTYMVFQKIDGYLEPGMLLVTTQEPTLYVVLSGRGKNMQIVVKIRDDSGIAVFEKMGGVQVKSLIEDNNWEIRKNKIKAVTDGSIGMFGSVAKLSNENSLHKLLQLTSIVFDELRAFSFDDEAWMTFRRRQELSLMTTIENVNI